MRMEYAWVDANVLLRFITGDPPAMAKKAFALFKRAEKGEIRLRLSLLTVAEVVWVLGSFYQFPKNRIAEVLVPLLTSEGIWTEDPDLLIRALLEMAQQNVDFADALLAELARRSGEPVYSFDKDFERLGTRRVEP